MLRILLALHTLFHHITMKKASLDLHILYYSLQVVKKELSVHGRKHQLLIQQ